MIAIVDYNAGNLTSVKLALDYLGARSEITRSPARILAAERVIFPGVGSAGAAMQNIRALGLADVLRQVVQRGTPFLGICLGAQIIFEASAEDGGVQGLGVLAGTVKRFHPTNPADKVPQIGWNSVTFVKPHPLFEGIESGSEFYFVHSYYPAPTKTPCSRSRPRASRFLLKSRSGPRAQIQRRLGGALKNTATSAGLVWPSATSRSLKKLPR